MSPRASQVRDDGEGLCWGERYTQKKKPSEATDLVDLEYEQVPDRNAKFPIAHKTCRTTRIQLRYYGPLA